MSDRDLLRRRVLADPADDTLRLAYADCLDEGGGEADREWAAIIRAMVGITAPVRPLPSTVRRHFAPPWWEDVRAGGLTLTENRNPGEWEFSAGPGRADRVLVRRGFVEAVACRARDWCREGDRLLELWPVRRVRVTDGPSYGIVPVVNGTIVYLTGLAGEFRKRAVPPSFDPLAVARGLFASRWPTVEFSWG